MTHFFYYSFTKCCRIYYNRFIVLWLKLNLVITASNGIVFPVWIKFISGHYMVLQLQNNKYIPGNKATFKERTLFGQQIFS